MKWFIFSDAHAYLTPLKTALDQAGFDINNPDHGLISCGDLLDRGPDTIAMLEFVLSLPKERTVLVRGNHEFLLRELVEFHRAPTYTDIHNGTMNTIAHLNGYNTIMECWDECDDDVEILRKAGENILLQQYWDRSVNYAIIDDNIFVHGYCPCEYFAIWDSLGVAEWKKWSWVNGHDEALDGKNMLYGKTIYFGHYHNSYGNMWQKRYEKGVTFADDVNDDEEWGDAADFSIVRYYKGADRRVTGRGVGRPFAVALDACTALTGVVNVTVAET